MQNNPLEVDLDHILSHTEDLWEELRGRRIFITGGTGFFGTWLLESFAWANDKLHLGAKAVVLTRDPPRFSRKARHLAQHPSIKFLVGDVRDFEYPVESFSHVIHAATESSSRLNDEDPLTMLDTIVRGTRHTLDFAVRCGARKFLLTSSGAVYGRQPPEVTHLPEVYNGGPDTMDPQCAYAEGKRIAELLCSIHSKEHGFETKIARCFAFVGPYLPLEMHFAIGNFIRDGLNGGPIVVKGDGTPYRSYLYAADLAIWLWNILIRGSSGVPYNVGSEQAITVSELARIVAGTFKPPPQVVITQRMQPNRRREQYVPSVNRIRTQLGVGSHVDLEEAIDRTIRWHLHLRRDQTLETHHIAP